MREVLAIAGLVVFGLVALFYTFDTAFRAGGVCPLSVLCAVGTVVFGANIAMLRSRRAARRAHWVLSGELLVLLADP